MINFETEKFISYSLRIEIVIINLEFSFNKYNSWEMINFEAEKFISYGRRIDIYYSNIHKM